MLIRLKADSSRPVYTQIADAVTAEIDRGAAAPGDRLPSARSLADALNVNMHTVLHAYRELDAAGHIRLRRGRAGAVVADREHRLAALVGTLIAEARRDGIDLRRLIQSIEEAW
jgi:GntR family transcriptional regulator